VLRALLWDVDGTLAETERYGHLVAFNTAFAEAGLPYRWTAERYGELLRIAGGRERLEHDLALQPDGPKRPLELRHLAEQLHRAKNAAYERIVAAGAIPLRPGVIELLEDCAAAGLPMGIVTTTSGVNIDVLLRTRLGGDWRSRFAVVVGAEQAPLKKPDPQAYARALESLDLTARQAVAIEDAPAGVAAARAAGVPVVVQHSFFFPDIDDAGALAAGPSLAYGAGWRAPTDVAADTRISLDLLAAWHASATMHAGN